MSKYVLKGNVTQDWIGLKFVWFDDCMDPGCKRNFKHRRHFFNSYFRSSSGFAKHDRRCTQFSDSASKFACGVQVCTCRGLHPLYYSYLKLLLVNTVV
jgi:hypothetical protein